MVVAGFDERRTLKMAILLEVSEESSSQGFPSGDAVSGENRGEKSHEEYHDARLKLPTLQEVRCVYAGPS